MDEDVDLVGVADVIRKALRSRTSDTHLIEDITQEAMLRVALAQTQLEPSALRAYAIVTARNLLIGHARKEAVARRHAHRVVDYTSLRGGEELTLEREETNALAHALGGLDESDRRLLLDHEVDNVSIATLAAREQTSAGAVAMRLSRARSALRLEFLLTFRHAQLPTAQCRPILLAVSAGDKRRQLQLGASAHLIECPACASLSEPLVTRRRGAAAWWALPTPLWVRRFGSSLRHNRLTQAAVAATVATVAVIAFLLAGSSHPAAAHRAVAAAPAALTATTAPATIPAASVTTTAPAALGAATATTAPATIVATTAPAAVHADAATTATTAGSDPAASTSAADDAASTTLSAAPPAPCPPADTPLPTTAQPGCSYTLAGAQVTEVPADEGFWVQSVDGAPMWIHLVGTGESPEHVRVGDTVTMRGTATPVGPDAGSGIPAAEADRLAHSPIYLSVAFGDVAEQPTS